MKKCEICKKEIEWNSVKIPLCDECLSSKELVAVEIRRLLFFVSWHSSRWQALQRWQHTLPEPYRSECCDILANGSIAPRNERSPTPFAPDQSGLILAQAEPVKEVLSPVESAPL